MFFAVECCMSTKMLRGSTRCDSGWLMWSVVRCVVAAPDPIFVRLAGVGEIHLERSMQDHSTCTCTGNATGSSNPSTDPQPRLQLPGGREVERYVPVKV
jgi:hypothetical protein